MTVVCCWLDTSYSRRRVTAIADSRAAIKNDSGNWTPLNDVTTKLFKTRVNCYRLSGLDPTTGVWSDPYYATDIGIGFAGHCFEAMSTIALYQRCVDQLVADSDRDPRPDPIKLAHILVAIASRWFRDHRSVNGHEVAFLLFGFSPLDGEPWAAQVEHSRGNDAKLIRCSYPLDAKSVFSIGDVGSEERFQASVAKIRQRIQKHAKGCQRRSKSDPPSGLIAEVKVTHLGP